MLYYTSLLFLLIQLPLCCPSFCQVCCSLPSPCSTPSCLCAMSSLTRKPHIPMVPCVSHFLLLLSRTHLLTLGVQLSLVLGSPGIQQMFSKHVQNEQSKYSFNIWKNPVIISLYLTHFYYVKALFVLSIRISLRNVVIYHVFRKGHSNQVHYRRFI